MRRNKDGLKMVRGCQGTCAWFAEYAERVCVCVKSSSSSKSSRNERKKERETDRYRDR